MRRAALLAVITLALIAATAVSAQHVPARVALIVPLSGPLASDGQAAMKAIERLFKARRIELLVLDDQGQPTRAAESARRAVVAEGIQVIIGGATTATLFATVSGVAAEQAVIVGLAIPGDEPRETLLEKKREVLVFAPVSRRYLDATTTALRATAPGDLFITFLGEPFRNPLLTAARRAGYSDSAIVAREAKSFEDFASSGTDLSARVRAIVGLAPTPALNAFEENINRSRPNVPVVLFAPPSAGARAAVAAELVAGAIGKGARKAPDVWPLLEQDRMVDRKERVIRLEWTTVTRALPSNAADVVHSTTGEKRKCKCTDDDGTVRSCECSASQTCKTSKRDGKCEVYCE